MKLLNCDMCSKNYFPLKESDEQQQHHYCNTCEWEIFFNTTFDKNHCLDKEWARIVLENG